MSDPPLEPAPTDQWVRDAEGRLSYTDALGNVWFPDPDSPATLHWIDRDGNAFTRTPAGKDIRHGAPVVIDQKTFTSADGLTQISVVNGHLFKSGPDGYAIKYTGRMAELDPHEGQWHTVTGAAFEQAVGWNIRLEADLGRAQQTEAGRDRLKYMDGLLELGAVGGVPVYVTSKIAIGAGESVANFAVFSWSISPARLMTDPDGWMQTMKQIGAGIEYSIDHPGEFAKAAVDWDTWQDDPYRALGHLLPDLVLGFVTGGTGTATSKADDVAGGLLKAADGSIAKNLARAAPDGAPPLGPVEAAAAADDVLVWVNRESNLYHGPGSANWRRLEHDPSPQGHWEKMPAGEAREGGYQAARVSDPRLQDALGAQRVQEFVADYLDGGRERMFGGAADPSAVHREVTLYSRITANGKEFYVHEPGRTLDLVDLTDPANPKVFEIGTQTPSKTEVGRKEDQHRAWEEAREAADELRAEGGDGQVYGKLPNGDFVPLGRAEYRIPPDVRHLLDEPPAHSGPAATPAPIVKPLPPDPQPVVTPLPRDPQPVVTPLPPDSPTEASTTPKPAGEAEVPWSQSPQPQQLMMRAEPTALSERTPDAEVEQSEPDSVQPAPGEAAASSRRSSDEEDRPSAEPPEAPRAHSSVEAPRPQDVPREERASVAEAGVADRAPARDDDEPERPRMHGSRVDADWAALHPLAAARAGVERADLADARFDELPDVDEVGLPDADEVVEGSPEARWDELPDSGEVDAEEPGDDDNGGGGDGNDDEGDEGGADAGG